MPKNSRNAPKRQTRIFYRNLQCFEPSQGRCEQSLYRAQGHFCWYLRCFLRFLAAHNGPFLGQNGPANLKFGTAPPPQTPPPKRSMPTTPSATALSVIFHIFSRVMSVFACCKWQCVPINYSFRFSRTARQHAKQLCISCKVSNLLNFDPGLKIFFVVCARYCTSSCGHNT